MNNFPAMTEEQRQELIELCDAVISSLLQYGEHTSLECDVYRIALAALTAEPDHYVFHHPAGKLLNHLASDECKGQDHVVAGYTAPPAPVLRVPAGWKLVPMVPTEAMIMAAQDSEDVLFDKDDDSLFIVDHKEIYRAMLENAPEASNEQ